MKIKNKILPSLIILVELVIWILIATKYNFKTNYVYIISTVVLLLFTLTNLGGEKNYLISLAITFTILSDVFLILADPRNQNLAMTFFSITQLLYFVYLFLNESGKVRIIHIILRVAVSSIGLLVTYLVLKDKTNYLALASLFYFANLILNFAFSTVNYLENKEKKYILLIVGFLFFICCDILIGLNEAEGVFLTYAKGGFIDFLVNINVNLAWLFYIPSQTCLALHTLFNKKNKNK